MKPPSKRTVRDAIRILGRCQTMRVGIYDASLQLGAKWPEYDLACDARLSDAATVGDSQHALFAAQQRDYLHSCAAAENLLREGWRP